MPQLLIVHRDDSKALALKLYAFFRNRLPQATIKPNTQAIINEGSSIGQGIFNSNILVVLVSEDWQNGWLHDPQDNDSLALKAALTTNKMLFVLRVGGANLPASMPDNLNGLRSMMSMEVGDDSLYQVSETLINYIAPMMPAPSQPSYNNNMPAPQSYPPNPHYPDSNRIIHQGLSPLAFQHPLDRAAIENLKKAKGFDILTAKILEYGIERVDHIIYAANAVKVGPNQYPKLHDMIIEASAILDMPTPDLYVLLGGEVNAYTFGHTRPYMVIFSPLLDLMNEDEIMAVIAHECGHIKCAHVLYQSMTLYVPIISAFVSGAVPVFGVLASTAIDWSVRIALMNWKRRSELSADRASLLVMQDPLPCVSMLAKLAGGSIKMQDELNLEAFMQQAEEYDITQDSTNLDKFYRFWAFMNQTTHPFPVERARFLNDYIDGAEYEQIMNGVYERMPMQQGY